MPPATMTEPSNVSSEENASRQRNVPSTLAFENPIRSENNELNLNVNNLSQGQGFENSENVDDSTGACSPRTPIPNPLKTFRFVKRLTRYL